MSDRLWAAAIAGLAAIPILLNGIAPATAKEDTPAKVAATAATADGAKRVVRNGLAIDFDIKPVLGSFEKPRDLYAQDYAVARFSIRDETSGEPVRGLIPGAWIDLAGMAGGARGGASECKSRIALYLQGSIGAQALMDLNSYFILALNEEPTITVIDPNVLIAGIGDMFYTQIALKRPGGDWTQNKAQTRVYVTMPRADEVAVVDTELFKVIRNVKTGAEPVRAALQADGRFLWVTYNGKGKAGGVTVIDTESLEAAADIPTGRGHHEIAFTEDDRHALVTNRDDGTVSVLDIRKLEKVKDIEVGAAPISIGYSSLSRMFYVADGASGRVAVLDGRKLEIAAWVETKPGLGPMRVSPDGRWVLVTNAAADLVHVIDTSTNTLAHDVPVKGKPYQISLTRAFAYVRALESERVSLINLAALGGSAAPPVVPVPFGSKAPSQASSLSIADTIVEAAGEAGVIAVNPAEHSLAFYMEGMNAPMGTFNSKGYKPRAVLVTDRSLAEHEPGVYSAKLQVPKAGSYDVAFVLDSPPVLHCFSFAALSSPLADKSGKPLEVEYLVADRKVPAGQDFALRFRLIEPATQKPRSGLGDVSVLFYRAPGRDRTRIGAREVGGGVYEAMLPIKNVGAYFVYVGAPSAGVRFGGLPYLTLRGMRSGASTGGTGKRGG